VTELIFSESINRDTALVRNCGTNLFVKLVPFVWFNTFSPSLASSRDGSGIVRKGCVVAVIFSRSYTDGLLTCGKTNVQVVSIREEQSDSGGDRQHTRQICPLVLHLNPSCRPRPSLQRERQLCRRSMEVVGDTRAFALQARPELRNARHSH
jgi:hypothetical protein